MKYQITAVRDLKLVLKDLEAQIRAPRHLRVGRNYKSFAMRPRELLGNWLLCVALCEATGRNWTLSEDPTGGDGAMLDRDTGTGFLTEHVYIPPPAEGESTSVEEKVIEAVRAKAAKGGQYARGTTLLVFSEAVGSWFPNRVGHALEGVHEFEAVWAVGLEGVIDGRYVYWVTHLEPVHSPAWRIRVAETFDGWTVEAVQ